MIITNLFINKILFMIEMLSGMYIFSHKMRKRSHPIIRYLLSISLCLLVAIFYPLVKDVSYSWWYISLMYFVFAIVSCLTLPIIYDMSWKEVLFFFIVAYTAQHFAYQLNTVLSLACGLINSYQSAYNGENLLEDGGLLVLRLTLTTVVFTLVYVTIYIAFISRVIKKDLSFNNLEILVISGVALIIDILVNAVIVSYGKDLLDVIEYMICLYSLINCFVILFLLYFVLRSKNLQKDLDVSSFLLNEAEKKYMQTKNNVDLINIKCHDMKQQIIAIGKSRSINQEALKDMTDAIQIYDSTMHSGNAAVDIILVDKKLNCNQQQINLKCYADCSKLDFISDSDIYSLFGNAIDNAIEATSKITDPSKKLINVFVKNINNFVSIRIENYFSGEIKFDSDGRPKSTKTNNGYHGFGIKSLEMIVKKYHGNHLIKIDDEVFSFNIFFPIDENMTNTDF